MLETPRPSLSCHTRFGYADLHWVPRSLRRAQNLHLIADAPRKPFSCPSRFRIFGRASDSLNALSSGRGGARSNLKNVQRIWVIADGLIEIFAASNKRSLGRALNEIAVDFLGIPVMSLDCTL
jgi:hypothetical protein